jgi:hypothetical protein
VKLEVVAPLALDEEPKDGGCREHLREAAQREMRTSAFPVAAGRVRVSARIFLAPVRDCRLDQLALAVVDSLTGVAFARASLVIGLLVTRMALETGGEERVDVSVVLDAGEGEASGRASQRAA